MANLIDLLKQSQELKRKQKELRQEMKSQKMALAVEFTSSITPKLQAEQIARAEKILETAKQEALKAKATFKATMIKIRSDYATAKEILSLVNHEQSNSLPHRKNSFILEKNILKFNRDGIKEITIDIAKENWQKTFKEALRLQGINGNDRVSDNIVYKASQLIKSNIGIAPDVK